MNLTPYMRCVVYKTIIAPLFEYCVYITENNRYKYAVFTKIA